MQMDCTKQYFFDSTKNIQEVGQKLAHFICSKNMTPADLVQNISNAILRIQHNEMIIKKNTDASTNGKN